MIFTVWDDRLTTLNGPVSFLKSLFLEPFTGASRRSYTKEPTTMSSTGGHSCWSKLALYRALANFIFFMLDFVSSRSRFRNPLRR